jgi:hypothetical protein
MIHVQSWRTELANEVKLNSTSKTYDFTYTDIDKYDDRSDWTFNYVSNISKEIITVSYCPKTVSLTINNNKYGIRKLSEYALPKGNILIDATTLALPEILHLFHLLNDKKRSFDVIYVQPTGYTESKSVGVDKIKSFDLSDDGLGIQQVPPYIGYSANSMLFFFLGFEGHRFGAIINSDEFDTRNITCLLGTPPFKLGWENRTLSNNYKQLADISSSSNARFKFAGANDPIQTYEVINQVYQSAIYEKRNLCLAPFGTKPAAIAAAQFAVNNNNVVMLYDYVKKKNKRSSGQDLIHTWSFQYTDKN